MLTGVALVSVTAPAGVTVPVGVTNTVYVRPADDEPQAIGKPAIEIANAVNNIALVRCFRRKANGPPSSIAHNITAPPPFQGTAGAWFDALLVVVISRVEVPVPPAVSVTGAAVAVTAEAVPEVELMLVTKVTVPA